MTLVSATMVILVFGGGALAGAVGVIVWWGHLMTKPSYVLGQLAQWWRRAHPHWLSISREDDRRACPCCGWSEERRETSRSIQMQSRGVSGRSSDVAR